MKKKAKLQQVLAVLEPDDLAAIRLRYNLWKQHELATGMLQESYMGKVQEIRDKYKLPMKFEVQFETGSVLPDEAVNG